MERAATRSDTSETQGIQAHWAERSVKDRLRVLRAARHELAARMNALVDAIPSDLARTRADSIASEVLPLLAACRFLEREAVGIIKPRRLGRKGLPFWLAGVDSSVERVPLGRVLVVGPSNYPLFLPGVQVLQALAAGNTVTWKPGTGGRPVAEAFAAAMEQAGLPSGVLRITSETVEAVAMEMNAGVDKVFFTGSGEAGRAVMRMAAEMATPVVAELSGCDAVVVLETADVERVVAAVAFGMRLNGSATCMAPRRLMLVGSGHEGLVERLRETFAAMDGVMLRPSVQDRLGELVADAVSEGAVVHGDVRATSLRPVLVLDGRPGMQIAQTDLFAPVLTVLAFASVESMLAAETVCPYGLTASVFGDEREALAVGKQMKVGTVLVNDLIVATADPRVSFGGRRKSGFGSTRGREGLLEMTAVKTVLVRRSKGLRQYAPTTDAHVNLLSGVVQTGHLPGLRDRVAGLQRMVQAAMRLK